jgi:hypothetical protein
MVPFAAFPPATPFTLQFTAVFALPVMVAVYCDVVPSVTLVAPLKVRPGVGGGGGVASVATRFCDTEESATLVAVMVTLDDGGSLAGAL